MKTSLFIPAVLVLLVLTAFAWGQGTVVRQVPVQGTLSETAGAANVRYSGVMQIYERGGTVTAMVVAHALCLDCGETFMLYGFSDGALPEITAAVGAGPLPMIFVSIGHSPEFDVRSSLDPAAATGVVALR